MTDALTKARAAMYAALARDGIAAPSRWRVIITDSESPTGVAPVCTEGRSNALHVIDDYPGGPERDEDGVYDCCPWPQFDTYSVDTAAYLVALLNADAEPSVDHHAAARREAADWFASHSFPSNESDWERGRDDALVWVVRVLRDPDPQRGAATGQGLDVRLDEQRTVTLAMVTAWLIKKGREFHASSRKAERAQGDTCAVLASQITRGAVRPDNLRMLPTAGFFEADRTYEYTRLRWQFRCDAVTTNPNTGECVALGWSQFGSREPWQTGEMSKGIWAEGGWVDVTEGGEGRG